MAVMTLSRAASVAPAACPAPVDPEDADLVRAAAGGDVPAFEKLVQRHHRRVFSFVLQMTRHREDAEDLTQQAFVKAFRHIRRADPARPIINWLFTIARRVLSQREFEVLWLRFAEEMSTKETARITGLTQIHVKVLVHRARRQLMKGEVQT